MNTCLRGCLTPCRCDQCIAADQPAHDPEPAPAEPPSRLCRRCTTRLERWLDHVLDDTLRLDTRIPDDLSIERAPGHQKITGSPALVRLDVAGLTDPRSSFGVDLDPTRDPAGPNQPHRYPENQDDHPPIDIPGEIRSWARLFAEEHRITSSVRTMSDAVGLLQRWWDTLVGEPWIDEFYTVMADIRQLLDAAHRVERPRPLGPCFTCDNPLYAYPDSPVVRCGRCGRRYDGLGLVKLEVQRRKEQV